MLCTAASMMIRANPLVFQSTNSAIVGLAQVVVVSQPTVGPPNKCRIAFATPKSLSKIRMKACAIAAKGVTYGRMTTVRRVFLKRSRVSGERGRDRDCADRLDRDDQ